MDPELSPKQRRVLILAPARNDAAALSSVIQRSGVATVICGDMDQLCREMAAGMGAAVITEEALLAATDSGRLQERLKAEPQWSEPPLLIVTAPAGAVAIRRLGWVSGFANIVFLERPLRAATLNSAVKAGMAARLRQWQVAEYIQQREQSEARLRLQEAQLRRLAETLEERVQQRTRDLAAANQQLVEEGERRARAEQALLHAQKLEAIGQLTGGVAHDFNNLLMAVLSGIELLKRSSDPQRRGRILDGIEQAAARGKSLTQQLLAFARNMELRAQSIDVRQLLDGMSILVSGALRGDIVVNIDTPADLWHAMADPTQLELAILNLVVNARDAMPSGGRLNVFAHNEFATGTDRPKGEFVAIAVRDTGEGIAPENLNRIFDPFFTTKAIGKGTGLGLSQVYGFVRQSGGDVRVESVPGEGTTITLYLPRAVQKAGEPDPPHEAGEFSISGRSALLVEDNDEVAGVVREMFEELGLQVDRVPTAREALNRLGDSSPYDVVLSDIVMPGGMNGIELARAIAERRPGLPVILATGYSDALKGTDGLEFPVLRKPYSLHDLGTTLQTVLGALD